MFLFCTEYSQIKAEEFTHTFLMMQFLQNLYLKANRKFASLSNLACCNPSVLTRSTKLDTSLATA